MKNLSLLTIVPFMLAGCGYARENDTPIALEKVPSSLVKVAWERLPGDDFQTAYKETKNGKEVYELRGKTQDRKIRDVEITADGEVLEVD
jgi:hypothetical protein